MTENLYAVLDNRIEAPPSLRPVSRYCDITGLNVLGRFVPDILMTI